MVGPTASCLIGMQFEVLKFGDRFWFETSETSSDGFALGFTSGISKEREGGRERMERKR